MAQASACALTTSAAVTPNSVSEDPLEKKFVIPTGAPQLFLACGLCSLGRGVEGPLFDFTVVTACMLKIFLRPAP